MKNNVNDNDAIKLIEDYYARHGYANILSEAAKVFLKSNIKAFDYKRAAERGKQRFNSNQGQ